MNTANNVKIEGKGLAAGSYGLHMAVFEDGKVTVIFSNNTLSWGSFYYDEKKYDLALKYFKLNVKRNPKNANVHDSLGEGYKASGDKKNAIKSFKKSLSLKPAANVKANSIKLLKELGVDTKAYEAS